MGRIVLSGQKEVKSELEGIEGVVERNKLKLTALGAAFTAVGAAGLALVQGTKELNTKLSQTGITLGLTTGQMRDLALQTTNASFPLQEVADTMEMLARAGERNPEKIKAEALAFDALADATGGTADAVAGLLIPGLKAMGEQLPQNANDLDRFTWLTKNTTVDLTDFASVMSYVAANGAELGLTSGDLIATLAVLESRGITGAAATRLMRTSITEANESGKGLNEVLGISQTEINNYTEKMEDAQGITKEYSDAADKQITLMDKVKQKWHEITLKLSPVLQPLQGVLGIMTVLGPVMIFAGSAAGIATVKFIAHTAATVAMTVATTALKVGILAWTAAQWLLNIALDANPIGLIIIAIGALIAIVVLLVKNWDAVSAFFVSLWNGLKTLFWSVVDWMKEWGILFLGPVGLIIKYWDGLVEFFKGIPERFRAAFSTLKDIILSPFRAAINGIETAINWLISQLNKIHVKLPSWAGGHEFGINIPQIDLPEFAEGGTIPEPTILYGLRSQRPYAMAGEKGTEYVVPSGGRSINIIVELDGRTIARAIGQPLVDEIRVRTGMRI